MKSVKTMFVATALLLACSLPAYAVLFDQNVTPDIIFGSGNTNGSFTVDSNNGVELGLRGKLRHNTSGAPENTFNSNGDGTYSFIAGVAPTQTSPTAVWSFEWSINSNYDGNSGFNLSDLSYTLGIDQDATLGTSFTLLDPINGINPHPSLGVVYWDHAIGTNATGNGAGAKAAFGDTTDYSNLIAGNNVAQNSWKAHWFISGLDPNLDGTYDFYLEAFEGTTSLARTNMQIIVGAGAAPVPEPSTFILMGAGLAGLAYYRRKKNS